MTDVNGNAGHWTSRFSRPIIFVILTLIVRLVLAPLFHLQLRLSRRSMEQQKKIAPQLAEVRKKYKNDPQKQQQEMMALYREHGINPLGGCLPLLIQMPVFLALYWVLQGAVEMRGATWMWLPDLTLKDPLFILPILYAISMFVTQKLNPQPADPVQAKMMMFMPIAFSVMFLFFPSGLVLYWVVNNLISMAQQYVITKKFAPK